MNKLEIAIIDHNLADALELKAIIIKYFPQTVEVNYYISLETAANNFKIKKPQLLFLDIVFSNNYLFHFHENLNLKDIKVIVISPSQNINTNDVDIDKTKYLQKPYNEDLIQNYLNSIFLRKNRNNLNNDFEHPDKVIVASLSKKDFINMNEIVLCAADGKYTTFHLISGKKIISSKNLGLYQKLLDSINFYRVHHAYIINIKYLISIIKNERLFCHLINDINVPVAKRKQKDFTNFLKIN